jgi:hypothetical protein
VGSSLIKLESIFNSNKRGALINYLDFPHSLRKLEFYFQILQPIHQFNVFIQRIDSTIAGVIPILLLTIYAFLVRLDLEDEDDAKKFDNLILSQNLISNKGTIYKRLNEVIPQKKITQFKNITMFYVISNICFLIKIPY